MRRRTTQRQDSLPLAETLSLPVRLLGQAAPGDILLSPQVGRQIEGWFALPAPTP
jgi:hypothetical protein